MKKILIAFLFLIFTAILFYCTGKNRSENEAPVLSVEESIQDFEIPEGFVIEPVCAEPLVEDPVALCFDEDAAMWVVEMRGYMHDKEGSGEDQPLGRIKVVRDTNADGKYDSATVFLDSLIMPRAVAVVKDGILLIEPPALYFVENKKGIAGRKVIIDSVFADEGNVEHQPNGLLLGMDNWYYCTSSDKRVRKIKNKWTVEKTQRRGQWGISADDAGRLYYNNNSVMLMTDNFLPGSFPVNKNHRSVSRNISNVQLANDTVFPRRQTRGVNRGYEKGVLDSVGKLITVTSACGPVIYRGDNFPKEFYGNAFVLEPVAFLVKRILLRENEKGFVKGKFAYPNKEFLTATDERFRPVNAYTSPDGCLYVIDMHRGVIQHTTYMTPYLRRHVDSLKLERPISMGRIYRVRWKEKTANKPLQLSNYSASQLIELLKHPNGVYRDMAHRLLVENADTSITSSLKSIVFDNSNPIASLQALWILEGLNMVTPEFLNEAANRTTDKKLYWSCIEILQKFNDQKKAYEILLSLRKKGDRISEIYFLNSLSAFYENFFKETESLINEIARTYPNDALLTDAIVNGLQGRENQFLKYIKGADSDTILIKALNKAIAISIRPGEEESISHLSNKEKQSYNGGKRFYTSYCITCHGKEGEGMLNIAPPLAGSEWVTDINIETPAKILLDGLTGPVTVNGILYAPPAYSNAMPGIRDNPETNNGVIADVLTFIRNSFGNKGSAVTAEQVGKIRAATADKKQFYKAEELKK